MIFPNFLGNAMKGAVENENGWHTTYYEWYGNHAPLTSGLLQYAVPSVPRSAYNCKGERASNNETIRARKGTNLLCNWFAQIQLGQKYKHGSCVLTYRFLEP